VPRSHHRLVELVGVEVLEQDAGSHLHLRAITSSKGTKRTVTCSIAPPYSEPALPTEPALSHGHVATHIDIA
jgi:hypothetical protein